jgi:sarcosine oxidase subunit beta
MRTADIAIIGAGLTGLSTGYWLAKAGARVVVVDKGRTAYEASSRATGYLSLRGDSPPEIPLAEAAEKLWDTLDQELGYPTEWTQKGRLWTACDEFEWGQLKETFADFSKTNIGFELIDGRRCREIVPAMTDKVIGGIYTPRSGHANPQRTSQAFAWAFRDRGGEILEYHPVLKINTSGGKVKGIETTQGAIHAPVVISCAGPQNSLIAAQFDLNFPIASARFEAMVTAPIPRLYDIALIAHQMSVRQTKRGNLHINGGPHEWLAPRLTGEPPKPNTPIVRNLARRVVELLPGVANVQLIRCWAGITEVTPDQACMIERFDSPEGLLMASAAGHGLGMAPSMGLALSELAMHGTTLLPIAELSARRFSKLPVDWRERINWQPGSYNT